MADAPDHSGKVKPRLSRGRRYFAVVMFSTAMYMLVSGRILVVDWDSRIFGFVRDPDVVYSRAEEKYAAGKLDKAAALYTEVIELDANSPRSHLKRGHIRYRQQRYAEAIADYSRTLELTNEPDLRMRSLVQRGYSRERAGDVDGAIADFDEALRHAASGNKAVIPALRIDALSGRATLRAARREWDAALADTTAAVDMRLADNGFEDLMTPERRGQTEDLLMLRARIQRERHAPEAALADLTEIIRRTSKAQAARDMTIYADRDTWRTALVQRSKLLRELGDLDGAYRDAQAASRLSPESKDVQELERDFPLKLASTRPPNRSDPPLADDRMLELIARTKAAVALLDAGRVDEAARDLEAVFQYDNALVLAGYWAAVAYARKGERGLAKVRIDRAHRLWPYNEEIRRLRAELETKVGRL